MDILDLKWKFQICYGNSGLYEEILDLFYGYPRTEKEIPDKMEIILLIWKFWLLQESFPEIRYNYFFHLECFQSKSFEPRKFISWVQKMKINLPDHLDFGRSSQKAPFQLTIRFPPLCGGGGQNFMKLSLINFLRQF